jgi:cytochrome c
MSMRITVLFLAAAGLLLAAPAADAGDPTKGAQVFKKCQACHNIGPGATIKVGPPLNGIVGRPAASIEGYRYSHAMQNSGLVFDAPTLTIYLKSPKALVPGTAMAFVGLKKDQDIADVIAFLSQFDATGNQTPPPSQ